MIWRLTDKIWWGGAEALSNLEGAVAVLAVGGNLENLPLSATPLALPEKIPYFRVASPDHEPIDRRYYNILEDVIQVISHSNLFPLLVHCRAGQQRSPAVAIFAAWTVQKIPLDFGVHMARQLRPDCMKFTNTGEIPPYCTTLLRMAGYVGAL